VKESESKEMDNRSFPGFIKQLTTDLVGLNPRKNPDWSERRIIFTDAWNLFMQDHHHRNEMTMRAECRMKCETGINLPMPKYSLE
jgi:hypothetical protein